MGDETLRGLLEKLCWADGSRSLPLEKEALPENEGLWAIKWIQGGVAAGATRAIASFPRGRLEIDLYGHFPADAKSLAKSILNDRIPPKGAERHWVMALRHLRNRQLGMRLASRKGPHQKQIVTIDQEGEMKAFEEPFEGGSGTLSVTVEPSRRRILGKTSSWTAEVTALRSRFRYCHLPIVLEKTLLNDDPVYRDGQVLMSWIEQALGDEPHFLVSSDPRRILAPRLVEPDGHKLELHRCSMLLALRSGPPNRGVAKVWWVKDGALVGPVRVVGATGVLQVEIVCPGDREKELSEWAARDPWSFFPDKLALSVVRRLAGGLDSLLPELVAREGFLESLMRQIQTVSGNRLMLPVDGRPCLALSGAFHASLKAFSMRNSLELMP